MSLEVLQVSKQYGTQLAVDQVSFSARPGQVLGFLGPNGAGKSTTMKVAAGYILPDAGDVLIDGISILTHPIEASRQIGYLPEHNPLYLEMYVVEFLLFVAGLYQLHGAEARQRVAGVIHDCGLEKEQHKRIGALSKGYRQRVGLAKALVHDPKVIILDEPTTGLDPNQLVEIRALIRKVSQYKTVILSTHIMQEVEAVCDEVVIIHEGKLVAQDSLKALKQNTTEVVFVLETQEEMQSKWFDDLLGLAKCHLISPTTIRLEAKEVFLLRTELMQVLNSHGLTLISLRQEERSLEHVFYELTAPRYNV